MTARPFFAFLMLAARAWPAGRDLIQQAPASSATFANPYRDSDNARRAGTKLYLRECAACHGSDRGGHGKAPPLNRADVRQAPAGNLFWVLRDGDLRRGMPSFAHLPEAQRWQIVTFLQAGTRTP